MREQNKLTGVKEIARRANVSLATVDRVINNRGGVSKKTKEKIELIIKELNYQPNILARRLASPKNKTGNAYPECFARDKLLGIALPGYFSG